VSGPSDYYPPEVDDPALHTLEYAVVDCETTGGSPARGDRITEIAVIRADREGRILDEFTTLLNPGRRIPRGITRITHIDDEMVADAPLFTEVAPRIQQALAGAVFVAHNAPFDLRFVEWEMRRGDFGPPKGKVLCTARLARKFVPEMRSRSLDALIHRWDIPCEPRHRAYPDARATVEILVRLLDIAAERGIGGWAELDAELKRRKKRKKRSALPRSMDYPEWA
jgi:DNA polymerase-3 subunit epsilon